MAEERSSRKRRAAASTVGLSGRRKPRHWLVQKLIDWTEKILQINDTPESIARGVLLGFVVAMTPTIGIQMSIVIVVNTIFRANRIAGICIVWLTNPFDMIPLYFADYVVGSVVLRQPVMGWHEFTSYFEKLNFDADIWAQSVDLFKELGWGVVAPMFMGGLVLGVILGVAAYPVTLWLVKRERAWRDRLKAAYERRRQLAAVRSERRARQAAGCDPAGAPSDSGPFAAVADAAPAAEPGGPPPAAGADPLITGPGIDPAPAPQPAERRLQST